MNDPHVHSLVPSEKRRTALRALFQRAPGRFHAIDGLRAVAVLWMISFHSLYFFGFFVRREQYLALVQAPSTYVLQQGHFGVDVFFVISGFLIASILLREDRERGQVAIPSFYVRRLSRVLPAYIVAILLWGLIAREHANLPHSWANLLLINNFFKGQWQAMAWSWSLAIEEQFYLLFPWLLPFLLRGTRRPISWLVASLIGGVLVTAILVCHYRIFQPVPAHYSFDPATVDRYFDTVYEKTYTRFGGIVVGVIVAFLAERKPVLAAWGKRRGLARATLVTAFAGLAFYIFRSSHIAPEQSPPAWQYVFYLATYRTFFSVLVGYVLFHLLALSQDGGEPGILGRVLSARLWLPFAELSYSAYLVHPMIVGIVYFVRRPAHADLATLLPCFLAIMTATWVVSFVIYRLVEFPCRERARRWVASRRAREIAPTSIKFEVQAGVRAEGAVERVITAAEHP